MVPISTTTEIRVRNDSDVDFQDVVVGKRKYGDIRSGAVTAYQTWNVAYRYASVMLIAGSRLMQIQAVDFLGEPKFGAGKFTYVITIHEGSLCMRSEQDDK